MRERTHVLAGPVTVTFPTATSELGALVTADVLARRAGVGGDPRAVSTAIVTGGLCHQYAAEEELWREGLDKAAVGREGFGARVRLVEEQAGAKLASLVDALALSVDVDEARRAGAELARAARVAFVRLFEAGLVVEAERVVGACPRCGTVADGAEAVPGVIDAEALVLRLSVLDGADAVGWLDVRCVAPEFVQGVAAVAVPEGHPFAGRVVAIPVAGTVVPVVADPSAAEPELVVPAHDVVALERARRAGLSAPGVVDATGTVRARGPLEGLARHAARAAARRLLGAEGVIAAVDATVEPVARCAACRTVLVPLLGRSWFLAMADLVTAAADAVREGCVVVSPAGARDELLTRAAATEDWCLSRQLWAGQPVPVAHCADCGSVDVSVEPSSSCRRCMGDLVPEDGVLDARFVSCLWPLWLAGWPDGQRGAGEPGGTTVVVPDERLADVLAMTALGLRLGGAAPFGEVIVAPIGGDAADVAEAMPDVAGHAASEGRAVVRLALVCGNLDLVAGRELAARLEDPTTGDADVDRLEEAVTAALDGGAPAAALGLLSAALAGGVPPDASGRVRALVAPFLGG